MSVHPDLKWLTLISEWFKNWFAIWAWFWCECSEDGSIWLVDDCWSWYNAYVGFQNVLIDMGSFSPTLPSLKWTNLTYSCSIIENSPSWYWSTICSPAKSCRFSPCRLEEWFWFSPQRDWSTWGFTYGRFWLFIGGIFAAQSGSKKFLVFLSFSAIGKIFELFLSTEGSGYRSNTGVLRWLISFAFYIEFLKLISFNFLKLTWIIEGSQLNRPFNLDYSGKLFLPEFD